MSVWAHLTFTIFVLFSSILHVEFNSVAPTAVHDENCHLVQVQYYCNGTFDKWNELITTLPGLYFFSVGALKPLQWVFGHLDDCSMLLLRSLSLVKGFGIFLLLHLIIAQKYPEVCKLKRAVASLNLAFFPMLYFYYFMYYTESLSMLLLLLMHYNHTKGSNSMAALFGALAVFTRQTNIVWVFWHALMLAWDICGPDPDIVSALSSLPLTFSLSEEKSLLSRLSAIGDQIFKGESRLSLLKESETPVRLLQQLLGSCCWYGLTGVVFVVFVIINGGIVVGDRLNHKACLNLPQLGYFSVYSTFFLLPVIISRLRPTFDLLRSNLKLLLGATLLTCCLVHCKTMMHWYLLSDNRHYIHYFGSAIYVWWPWLKFALIPLYIFGWTWILRNLEGSVPFKAALVLSIALSVVPQLLMEFRYFVPGFIFIRLHLRAFKWKDMAGEFLLYAIVNYLTFNQFLYQSWETSTGTQRIMW